MVQSGKLPKVPKIIQDEDVYYIRRRESEERGRVKIVHYKGKNGRFNRFVESVLNGCFLCCLSCLCLEVD